MKVLDKVSQAFPVIQHSSEDNPVMSGIAIDNLFHSLSLPILSPQSTDRSPRTGINPLRLLRNL